MLGVDGTPREGAGGFDTTGHPDCAANAWAVRSSAPKTSAGVLRDDPDRLAVHRARLPG
jgi:hypothetical protein